MTTKSHKPKSKKGPAKVSAAVKLLRSAASALEHGRHSTAQKKFAIIAGGQFTPRQTDAIIAALRLLQQPSVDPEWIDDLASQHGEPLNNAEIDKLVEQINTPAGEIPKSVKEARAGLIPSDETDAMNEDTNPLRYSDKELDVLDVALNVAEDILTPLLRFYSADQVKQAFDQHVQIHLGTELANIEAHAHRNDDPDEEPQPTIYVELLELAELVNAANTEFEGLESGAKNVLDRVKKLNVE